VPVIGGLLKRNREFAPGIRREIWPDFFG